MKRQRFSDSGMTLLEVLVSLMIIAIAMGTVFESLGGSRRIGFRADAAIDAVRIANNLLGNPLLMNDIKEAGSGQISGPVIGEPGWNYAVTAVPLVLETSQDQNEAEVPDMIDLVLCVSSEAMPNRSYCLHRWVRQGPGNRGRAPMLRSRPSRF